MIIQAQAFSDGKSQTILCRTSENKLVYCLPPPQLPPQPQADSKVVPSRHIQFSSKLPRTNEVCDNIESVMDMHRPTSAGFYYYVEVHQAVPNPDLEIVGLGPLGSPVSEEEVLDLVSVATPVNRRATRSVVKPEDPVVANLGCWEIGRDKLSFTNPLWHQWINETQVNICGKLYPTSLHIDMAHSEVKDEDVDMENAFPKMVLNCLRIWRPCAEQSSVREISRAGSFATVMIILPSEYSAGQITLSSGTTTRSIDLSADSIQSTSIVAWQNDFHSTTRNITSGLRLALIYDIVLPPHCPRPRLSSTYTIIEELSHILRKWSQGKYETVPPHQFAAYLLQNYYSDDLLLNKGEMALSGTDRQKLGILQDAAVRSGYTVCLVNIRHTEAGVSFAQEDEEFDSDSDGIPDMDEVAYTDTYIGPILVYPDGNCLAELSEEVKLEIPGTIIQAEYEDILQCSEATDKEFEEYGPEDRGTLYLNHRRTAVLMFRADLKDDVTWELGDVPYALKQIYAEHQQSSDTEKAWARRILREIETDNWASHLLKKDGIMKLADCALSWKDVEIWRRLGESCKYCTIEVLGHSRMLRARKMFGFANVTNSFQKILGRSPDMWSSDTKYIPEKLEFLYALVQYTSSEEMDETCGWCRTVIKALLSYSWQLDSNAVAVVLKVLQYTPLDWFNHYTLPNILKASNTFTFMMSLVEALRENQQIIVQKQIEIDQSRLFAKSDPHKGTSSLSSSQGPVLPATSAKWKEAVDQLEIKCLLRAASQWDTPEPKDPRQEHIPRESSPRLPLDMPPRRRILSIERILRVVELAFRIRNKYEEVCKHLLDGILKSPGPSSVKLIELYMPLMAPLRELLRKQNQTVHSPPFAEFFQSVIARYLSDILGNKAEARNYRLRRVGCQCLDCRCLNDFMLDTSSEEQLYTMPKRRRLHFEDMLSFSPDLCTFETVPTHRPSYSILVKKLPEVVMACAWDRRVSEAVEFLKSVGTDEEVSNIMGDRYLDVEDALAGIRPFVVSVVA